MRGSVGRYALLVAAGEYQDETLNQLRAPQQDIERLAAVLEDPDVGGFTSVTAMCDATDYEVRMAIENLLTDRDRDDLVLLYFSCHGMVDVHHRLYFATTNTQHNRPGGSAVSRSFVNEQLEMSAARAKVLVLDCCYSGAFAEGFKAAVRSPLDGQAGRGYVVMAASDAYEYAYEADGVTEAAPRTSVFTDVLIEGLASGAADFDGDGRTGVDELFRYVYEGVTARHPNQTPRLWAHDAEPNIYLGRAHGDRTPAAAAQPARPGMARPNNYNRNQIAVARGLRAVADRVSLMIGPLGRHIPVLGEDGFYAEVVDAAGFTARYRAADPRDQLGTGYAAEIVTGMRQQVGDGAATAVVLAQAMFERAGAALRAGAHPMALVRGVNDGAALVVDELAEIARDVETKEQIERFVCGTACDATAGEIIAEAMDKVGKEGTITVEESNAFGLELELSDGLGFDKGYISPSFCTEQERMEVILFDPYILIVNSKISAAKDLLPVLEKVQLSNGKPLLVIAKDVEGEALATLIANKARGTHRSVAVRAPGFGDRRTAQLTDIAIVTGGEVINEESGIKLENVTLDLLGRARNVVVAKDGTTIVDGAGDPNQILGRINQIRAEIEKSDSNYDREKLQERLAKLVGGVAVINVGAANESERQARRLLFERSVRAARTTIEYGLVPGAGSALRSIAPKVAAKAGDDDHGLGIRVVAEALDAPFTQILANAGIDPDLPMGTGVDIHSGQEVDLFASGIFDSAGGLRAAVTAAAEATVRFLRVA